MEAAIAGSTGPVRYSDSMFVTQNAIEISSKLKVPIIETSSIGTSTLNIATRLRAPLLETCSIITSTVIAAQSLTSALLNTSSVVTSTLTAGGNLFVPIVETSSILASTLQLNFISTTTVQASEIQVSSILLNNVAKTFVIDHPTDPLRHLVHACLEGPEAGVYYRGESAIQQGKTSIVIQLPYYASYIASNFTVQITPIVNGENTVILAFGASRVSDNQFTVYGPSGGNFYWHVTGQRLAIDVEPLRSDVTVIGDGPYRYIR